MAEFIHITVFLLVHFSTGLSKSEEIKYELSVTTSNYTYDISIHNNEVITSEEHAFSITILSDFPFLRPGMLNITPETYYFWMDDHNLEVIVPGAFDNQNITEEIRFTRTKLTKISSGTFKNLKIKKLTLMYNDITHLEENAISDLPNLWELHLSRNKIVTFHENSIVGTPKMWSFDMSHNKLEKLEARCLSFMKKDGTVIVGLACNEIQEIDPAAFSGISLWNLALSKNKLRSIPEEVFSKNALQLLDLDNNELSTLPGTFFEQDNLTDVNLGGNRLQCSVQNKLKKLSGKIKVRILYDNLNC